MSENVYLGNPNLKRANTQIEFTEDQVVEFLKCKDDPVYFALNYTSSLTEYKSHYSQTNHPTS